MPTNLLPVCFLGLVVGLAGNLCGAIVPVTESGNSELFFDASILNNDLINSGQATFSSVAATRPTSSSVGTTGSLNNGVPSTGSGNTTNNAFYAQANLPNSVTFRLNTATNVNGYDLMTIQTIAGWAAANSTQANQKYEILVSQVGSPVFTSLGTFTYTPFTSGSAAASTRITLTDSLGALASNIDAVRFNFARNGFVGNNVSSGTVYRELDIVGTASIVAAPAFTNLIQNGSFEANTVASNNNQAFATGNGLTNWTVNSGTVTLVNGQLSSVASDGNQWLSLEAASGFGSISQTIATVPGYTYELSFDYNVLSTNTAVANPWKLTYDIAGNAVELALPNSGVATSQSAWEHLSTTFVATGTSTTFSFTGYAQVSGFYGMSLDNVAVTLAAIPEPGSVAWMLGGIAGLSFLARRKYNVPR